MIENLKLLVIALILTIIIEAGISWLWGLRSKKEISAVALVNVITNPLLNYLILVNSYFNLIARTDVLIWILEAGVVFAEWRLLAWVLRESARKMLVLSLVMNACSYGAGLLLSNYV